MGYPRYLLVPPGTPGVYHCVSRCVRRAFLCGNDPDSGRSFEHRKQWLEARILELGTLFAVAVHAYAIMSNHFHIVVEIEPDAARHWSDEEVARRWIRLTSRRDTPPEALESRLASLTSQTERLTVLRERLGSLSWFMRFLKEPVARRANAEDECTGRFWEGRFRTQALLDDSAVLACMAYVDLNPVRAGIAKDPRQSPHTSMRRRVRARTGSDSRMSPLASSISSHVVFLSTRQYFSLVDWTAGQLHEGGLERTSTGVPLATLERLEIYPQQWLIQVRATESRYWRAIGRTGALIDRARVLGKRWLCGIGTARDLERLANPG